MRELPTDGAGFRKFAGSVPAKSLVALVNPKGKELVALGTIPLEEQLEAPVRVTRIAKPDRTGASTSMSRDDVGWHCVAWQKHNLIVGKWHAVCSLSAPLGYFDFSSRFVLVAGGGLTPLPFLFEVLGFRRVSWIRSFGRQAA